MKEDKIRLILMIALLLALIGGWMLWVYPDLNNSIFDTKTIALVVPLIIITVAATMIIGMKYKGAKRGLPTEDEMSRTTKLKAGAYAFYTGIYWLLALAWFGDNYFERPSQAVGTGIIGMATIFLVLFFYFNKKGVNVR